MLAAAVGIGEESILAVQCDRPDGAFDDVGVDLDAAVVEEAGEPLPPREGVADRLGELGLLADQAELLAQPWLEHLDDRPALLSARGPSLVGTATADLSLDAIESGNVLQRLAGDRSRARRGKFVEAPANMRPAEVKLDVAALGKDPIPVIAVDLQHTLEAGKMGNRPLGLAVRRVDVSHARRIGAAPRRSSRA